MRKAPPRNWIYEEILSSVNGLEMYIYIRIGTNITGLDEVEGEGERENEKKKFALKSVENAPFENEVFVDGENVKGPVIGGEWV